MNEQSSVISLQDALRDKPEHLTNAQLIRQILPDLDQRLGQLKQNNPDMHGVIESQSMMTLGFRPFVTGITDFFIMRTIYPDLQERLGTFALLHPKMFAVFCQRLADPATCPKL